MRVRIAAGEREIEIETGTDINITHTDLAGAALQLWRDTAAALPSPGPAFGVHADISTDRPPTSTAKGLGGIPE